MSRRCAADGCAVAGRPKVPAGAAASGARAEWSAVRRPYGPRQQFEAGRRAAAAALAATGAAGRAVPRERDGRPRFPPGFAGSIAHTERLAVAVVVPGAAAVGVDVESAVISPRVARFVLRERERRTLLPPAGDYRPRELFAAKEAAFKGLYATGALEDFLFWRIELSRSDGALTASHRGVAIPVWVHSEADLSLAVAIRM
ncbi:4'-phosphopantetheinyl transferase family protein [Actinomadura mexicana]|uniref:4'-phosphopantetheinyl transferase superfamily protein n=1 Tax=Actinomadura mexicana TaxID=134959 RepID=A0A238XK52_9ACTN|nr:4'-phosphopantetheinyl transferase superfamily protein [Actinomadura mexicana]SNR59375.1 4'-phosphopantetheinyl transferase superfamily protein [Actinomadura mexicana]